MSAIALAPFSVALNLAAMDDKGLPPVEVIPAPNAAGVIAGKDGRRYRVKSMAALAQRIAAQEVAPRVDFDHRSERISPTFSGSTAADGWVKSVAVNSRGGINAVMELSSWALNELRRKAYRYLSPALMHDADMELMGLSSVALVNDPNFHLPAPAINRAIPGAHGSQPAFVTPAGFQQPDAARMDLHNTIMEHALQNGISYRDAALHFGAMGH